MNSTLTSTASDRAQQGHIQAFTELVHLQKSKKLEVATSEIWTGLLQAQGFLYTQSTVRHTAKDLPLQLLEI